MVLDALDPFYEPGGIRIEFTRPGT